MSEEKGLYRLRLVDHAAGRGVMVGWIVNTPEGKGKIRYIEKISVISGKCQVCVELTPGQTTDRLFDAGDVSLLT